MTRRLHNEIVANHGGLLCAPAAELLLAEPSSVTAAPSLRVAVLRPLDLTESHGVNITPEIIQAMAEAYDPSIEAASLNFDHVWGGPSLGWCETLELDDGVLWALYRDLAEEAVQGVRSKRYTRQSAEFLLRHPGTQTPYFTGLALLGNARPAVFGLPSVQLNRPKLFLGDEPMPASTQPPAAAPPAVVETPQTSTPGRPPSPLRNASDSERLAALEQQITQLTQENQRLTDLVPEVGRLTADNHRLLAMDRISALGARLTPAMQDRLLPLLLATADQQVTLAVKGKTQQTSLWDAILSVLAAQPEMSFMTSNEIAIEDPDSPLAGELASSGLSPERLQDLERRFKFTQSPVFRRS
jgi:hypothetical protein